MFFEYKKLIGSHSFDVQQGDIIKKKNRLASLRINKLSINLHDSIKY